MKAKFRAYQDPISLQWIIQELVGWGKWEQVAVRNAEQEAADLVDRLQHPRVLYPRNSH